MLDFLKGKKPAAFIFEIIMKMLPEVVNDHKENHTRHNLTSYCNEDVQVLKNSDAWI